MTTKPTQQPQPPTDPTRKTLKTVRLSKKFRDKTVLQEVSIHVNSGEIIGLFGSNGAGKTTCFHIIVGILRTDQGAIYLDQQDISALPIHRRANLGIVYLPQEKSIFTDLTALENVQAILEIGSRAPAEQNRRRARQILEEMRIAHLADAAAVTLSGGERRRVEIARLLALSPAFVLMDEPFAALSPVAVREMQQIIIKLKSRNIGIFITDHNFRETLEICDRAYILHASQVLMEGQPRDIKKSKKVQEVYSGDMFKEHEQDHQDPPAAPANTPANTPPAA